MALFDKGSPHISEVKAGKTVYLCRCGNTNSPPFCDGSHKATNLEPFAFTPDKDGSIYVCGCGKSANKPFCDGSHNR